MNILLIEDNRFFRVAMERILAGAGHSVTAVGDGHDGLQAARTCAPALIFLDLMLPGLDGLGVLKALKKDPSTATIPVIVVTGLSQKNEAKLLSAGASAYIEKSSLNLGQNGEVLLQSLDSVLSRSAVSVAPAI
jgi:CheY-like chemotaxis protein